MRSLTWPTRPSFMNLSLLLLPLIYWPLPASCFLTIDSCIYKLVFLHAFKNNFVLSTWNNTSFCTVPYFSGVFSKVSRNSSQILLSKCFPWSLCHFSEEVNYLLLYLWICLLHLYFCAYSTRLWFVPMSSSLPNYSIL